MVSSINKKFLYLILILFLPYSSYAWQEVSCSSINKEIDIIHGHYSPQKCWTNQYQGVESYFADFEKDGEYECCHKCYLQFAESRREEWKNGWRPKKEEVHKKFNNYFKTKEK